MLVGNFEVRRTSDGATDRPTDRPTNRHRCLSGGESAERLLNACRRRGGQHDDEDEDDINIKEKFKVSLELAIRHPPSTTYGEREPDGARKGASSRGLFRCNTSYVREYFFLRENRGRRCGKMTSKKRRREAGIEVQKEEILHLIYRVCSEVPKDEAANFNGTCISPHSP